MPHRLRGFAVLFVATVLAACVAAPSGSGEASPSASEPAASSGPGWRVVSEPGGSGGYTIGAALTVADAIALWDQLALDGTPPRIDYASEILAVFGPAVSSSCPDIRFDGVGFDLDGRLVFGRFTDYWELELERGGSTPGACTADARPHPFVVALDRDALPSMPFVLRLLETPEICPGCMKTPEVTVGEPAPIPDHSDAAPAASALDPSAGSTAMPGALDVRAQVTSHCGSIGGCRYVVTLTNVAGSDPFHIELELAGDPAVTQAWDDGHLVPAHGAPLLAPGRYRVVARADVLSDAIMNGKQTVAGIAASCEAVVDVGADSATSLAVVFERDRCSIGEPEPAGPSEPSPSAPPPSPMPSMSPALALRTSQSGAKRTASRSGVTRSVLAGPLKAYSPENRRADRARGLGAEESYRAIGRRLSRAPSTILREVRTNGGLRRYRAWQAELGRDRRARRPRTAKLARNRRLRLRVEELLALLWSPEQIAARLRHEYPCDPEMWVSHETIYQSLFVQGRGALRRELARHLRTGRINRRPRGTARRSGGQIRDMVLIRERPAEIEDRAIPGHWEGDLLAGFNNKSAIATLVER